MSEISMELVQTADGSFTVRHPEYGEEFHSKQGARTEAESLYRDASGFAEHLASASGEKAWGVLDVGLGLGYNALMTLDTWWHTGGVVDLKLTSLEHTRLLVEALADPDCSWKEGWPILWRDWSSCLRESSLHTWTASWVHPKSGKCFEWEVLLGDARNVDLSKGSLRYIWQDAFSPKKNPELWTPEWFRHLRDASRADVCLVTYSVARVVKDSLTEAGWNWVRLKASEHKKQWLRASLSAKV